MNVVANQSINHLGLRKNLYNNPKTPQGNFVKPTPILQNKAQNITFGCSSKIIEQTCQEFPDLKKLINAKIFDGYKDVAKYSETDILEMLPTFKKFPEWIFKLGGINHNLSAYAKDAVYMCSGGKEIAHYAQICGKKPEKAELILEEMRYTYPTEPEIVRSNGQYIQSRSYQMGYMHYDETPDYKAPLVKHFKKYKEKLDALEAGKNVKELLDKKVTTLIQAEQECPNLYRIKGIEVYGRDGCTTRKKFNDDQILEMYPTFKKFPDEVSAFARYCAKPSNSCYTSDYVQMCYSPQEIINLAKIYATKHAEVDRILEQMWLKLNKTESTYEVEKCFKEAKEQIEEIGARYDSTFQ